MICSMSITSPVQSEEIFICKGTYMKTKLQLKSQGLLPAECQAVAACMGSLLTALGNLLQEILITIGDKLNQIGKAASV
jgi:hypothetical protein